MATSKATGEVAEARTSEGLSLDDWPFQQNLLPLQDLGQKRPTGGKNGVRYTSVDN